MAIPRPQRTVKDDSRGLSSRRGESPRNWQLERLEDRILLSDWGAPPHPSQLPPLTQQVWHVPIPVSKRLNLQTIVARVGGLDIGASSTPDPYSGSPTVTSVLTDETSSTMSSSNASLLTAVASAVSPATSPFLALTAAKAQAFADSSLAYSASGFLATGDWRVVRPEDPSGSTGPLPPPPFGFRGSGPVAYITLGLREDPGPDPIRAGFRSFLNAVQIDLHRDHGMIGQSPDQDPPPDEVALPEVHDLPPLFHQLPFNEGDSGVGSSGMPEQSVLQGTGQDAPAGAVSIWVSSSEEDAVGLPPSVILSQGGIVLGSLFLDGNQAEWDELAATVLDELLSESAALSLPLLGRLQLIAELGPLDDSSLALAATLLTVASESQTRSGSTEEEATTSEADMPEPPTWAGFVIGLDEAFEANRLAAHDWPTARIALQAGSGLALTAEPPRDERSRDEADEPIDEALRLLDREGDTAHRTDELFVPIPSADEDEPPEDTTDDILAGAASLVLATAPALLAGKVGPAPSPRRDEFDVDRKNDGDEDADEDGKGDGETESARAHLPNDRSFGSPPAMT